MRDVGGSEPTEYPMAHQKKIRNFCIFLTISILNLLNFCYDAGPVQCVSCIVCTVGKQNDVPTYSMARTLTLPEPPFGNLDNHRIAEPTLVSSASIPPPATVRAL